MRRDDEIAEAQRRAYLEQREKDAQEEQRRVENHNWQMLCLSLMEHEILHYGHVTQHANKSPKLQENISRIESLISHFDHNVAQSSSYRIWERWKALFIKPKEEDEKHP